MKNPEIKISYYEDFPSNIIDDFVETAKGDGYDIILKKNKRQFYNFIEDFLPTIVIFLATSFVAGFLNKAGSDSYDKLIASIPKLKKSVSQFLLKIKDLKVYKIQARQEPEPTNCNFSLILQILDNLNLEFFFSGQTDIETLQKSSDTLFAMLTDKDFKNLIEKLISQTKPDDKHETIKLRFDTSSDRWEIFDPVEEKFKRLEQLQKEIISGQRTDKK